MITDKIKYIADLIMSFISPGSSAEKNYKQFPLSLAIFVCVVTLLVLGVLGLVGVPVLLNYLSQR